MIMAEDTRPDDVWMVIPYCPIMHRFVGFIDLMDRPYEVVCDEYQKAAERFEHQRLMSVWTSKTPDGRTVGEVMKAQAKAVTKDADLPAVGSFHG